MKPDNEYDEISLFQACVDKNEAAWSIFVTKYSALISTAIRNNLKKHSLTLQWEDIDDIKQNVLMHIWNEDKLKTLSNPKSLPYWIAIVSGNAAIEYSRIKMRTEPKKQIQLVNILDSNKFNDIIHPYSNAPSKETTKSELSEHLDKAIESLSYKEKIIIKLHLLHNKTYEEIADILKIPFGTICSYVKRSKAKLANKLQDFR